MKKKQILCLFAMIATGFMASISQTVIAASTWELPGIGSMKLPANVEFTEGIYDSIPFIDNEQYSEWYFGKNTVKNGHYYVMTYSKPPHYSYGWALSEEVGYPYLLKAGVTTTGKETQEEQLDMIADYINEIFVKYGSAYTASKPLRKVQDKKNPRWEGRVILTKREEGVIYKEAYQIVLQISNARIVLGVINSDAGQGQLTNLIQAMVNKRKLPQKKQITGYLKSSK